MLCPKQAEAASIPVADEMYEAYSDVVSLPSSEVCFKSYYIVSFETQIEFLNFIPNTYAGLWKVCNAEGINLYGFWWDHWSYHLAGISPGHT